MKSPIILRHNNPITQDQGCEPFTHKKKHAPVCIFMTIFITQDIYYNCNNECLQQRMKIFICIMICFVYLPVHKNYTIRAFTLGVWEEGCVGNEGSGSKEV